LVDFVKRTLSERKIAGAANTVWWRRFSWRLHKPFADILDIELKAKTLGLARAL
jgi:hypothetical protein